MNSVSPIIGVFRTTLATDKSQTFNTFRTLQVGLAPFVFAFLNLMISTQIDITFRPLHHLD